MTRTIGRIFIKRPNTPIAGHFSSLANEINAEMTPHEIVIRIMITSCIAAPHPSPASVGLVTR
jgi:hypothetical protein